MPDLPDRARVAAIRLAGYIDGLRREGSLDGLSAGHLANIDRYLVELGSALEGAGRFGGVSGPEIKVAGTVAVADLRAGDLFVWGGRTLQVTDVMPAKSKRAARYLNTIEPGTTMVRRLHYWDTERVTTARMPD